MVSKITRGIKINVKVQYVKQSLHLNNLVNFFNYEISIENQMPEDFFSIDLRSACDCLGEITGESVGEDLVNEIFSKFCMGK